MSKRAGGKRLIGAQASAELWKGVDKWLEKYPQKTVTDFVLDACLEKLKVEGIRVDEDAALQDGRRRQPFYPGNQPGGFRLNERPARKTNSTSRSKGKGNLDKKIAASVRPEGNDRPPIK